MNNNDTKTLKNFGQSKSDLENLVESTDTEELDDATLLAVNGGIGLNVSESIDEDGALDSIGGKEQTGQNPLGL